MRNRVTTIQHLLKHPLLFCECMSGIRLRSYQVRVAERIIDSVHSHKGHTIVVVFPRQSGKNELQAHLEANLLLLTSRVHGEIVKVSPTWKPQSLNAMRRLERVLDLNMLTRGLWIKELGYIYRLDTARIYFLSGQPSANIVGATASTLLECDEAQDVLISKWDKEVAPMAASTNATKVFWGTAWTSSTLLARELDNAQQAQESDGEQRVFIVNARQVGAEVPSYRKFVASEVHKLGRNHPFIRTQYFSETIDAESSMFSAERQALMRGSHTRLTAPEPGKIYGFLIDVAGQDESALSLQDGLQLRFDFLSNPGRDATALTIVEIDLSTLEDELIRAPRYLVRSRKIWSGIRHTDLYAQLKALADLWEPGSIVIDATGIGAGISSFLEAAFGQRVIPYLFNIATKSRLGWDFLAVIETGRFKDHQPDNLGTGRPSEASAGTFQAEFWRQVRHTQMEIAEGPGHRMKWGVPDGTRDLQSGDLIHDDLVISAALCSVLDGCKWGNTESVILAPEDPLGGFRDTF